MAFLKDDEIKKYIDIKTDTYIDSANEEIS